MTTVRTKGDGVEKRQDHMGIEWMEAGRAAKSNAVSQVVWEGSVRGTVQPELEVVRGATLHRFTAQCPVLSLASEDRSRSLGRIGEPDPCR